MLCWLCVYSLAVGVFFFKQKTAYEMRISDWSSDVCSSDLSADADRCAIVAGDEVDLYLTAELMKTGRIDLSVQFVRQAAADQGNGGPLWGEYGWSGIKLMTMPCACWTALEQWARANRLVQLPIDRESGVEGKSVSVREDLGGGRSNKKKN